MFSIKKKLTGLLSGKENKIYNDIIEQQLHADYQNFISMIYPQLWDEFMVTFYGKGKFKSFSLAVDVLLEISRGKDYKQAHDALKGNYIWDVIDAKEMILEYAKCGPDFIEANKERGDHARIGPMKRDAIRSRNKVFDAEIRHKEEEKMTEQAKE